MASYRAAPEVATIVDQLIDSHHPHLADVPIACIFRDEAFLSRGRLIIGRAKRITGMEAFLVALAAGEASDEADPGADHDFFVIEIAEDTWGEMPPAPQRALVDHELCHCDVRDDGQLRIRGHDIEEFIDIALRHGQWSDDLAAFAAVCSTTVEAA